MEPTTVVDGVSREELAQDKRGSAAEENYFHWCDRTSEWQWPSAKFASPNFGKPRTCGGAYLKSRKCSVRL